MQAGRHQGGARVRDGVDEHGRVQGCAQVSSEQVLCCQHWHLPMGQPSWRAWWEVLPASFKDRKAVKGWISQTDTNCIHFCCLVHFKFHSLILVLCPFIFFSVTCRFFQDLCILLCTVNSVWWLFWFPDIPVPSLCLHTHGKAEKKVSVFSSTDRKHYQNMKLIHCQPLRALRVSLFPPVLSIRVILLSHCLFCSAGQTE